MLLFRFAIISLISTQITLAQSAYGRITGRVVDPSNAYIAAAQVRVVQIETNIATATNTNEEGVYELLNLLPGQYKISVERDGFKRFERGPLEVRVGDVLPVDVMLEVGAVSESVTVTTEAPLLESATASMSQVIDQNQISNLPIPGGSVNYLMQLSPGVIATNAPTHGWLPQARDSVSNISVAGSRTRSSEFQLDGVPNMEQGGIIAFSPPPEMVQEFRVQTAAFDASVGRFTGAAVNMVLKGGSNEYHGNLWFSHLSRPLMTHPFFVNKNLYDLSTGPVTPEKRNSAWPPTKTNRYRASVGGPVVLPKLYNGKNKTFFQYGNDFMLRIFSGSGYQTVPTQAQRAGDFSALLALSPQYQIYDPFTTVPIAGGRFQRQPLAGNIIPRSLLDPTAQKILSYFPMPNQAGSVDFRNNFQSPPANRIDYVSHMIRIDQVVSERQRFYTTYSFSSTQGDQGRVFRNDARGTVTDGQYHGIVFDDVWTLRNDLVLNFRYGLTRRSGKTDPASITFDLATLGWPSSLVNSLDRSITTLPVVNIDGYAALVDATVSRNAMLNHFLGATATHVRGTHSLRFGIDYRVLLDNNFDYGNYTPSIDFAAAWTRGPTNTDPTAPIGQGLASFLYGLPTGGGIARNSSFAQASKYLAGFLHDDWKLTRRLTLNLGLRYEVEHPATERYNRANRGFDFATPNPIEAQARANYARNPIPEIPVSQFRTTGGLLFPGVNGVPRNMWNTDANNFSPRIGLAYTLFPKTVVRAGYGIFFESLGVDRINVGQQGFDQRTNLVASNDNGVTFYGTLRNPFPVGYLEPIGAAGGLRTFLGRTPSYMDPNRRTGYMQRWSFTLQQELPGRMLIELGYIGNRGTALGISQEWNVTPAEYLSKSPERDQATINYLSAVFPNPFNGMPDFAGTGLQGVNISRANLLRPYPHFAGVNTDFWNGFSWYHAGHVRFERRMAKGFSIQVSYTWSKFMEAIEKLNPQDLYPHKVISPQDRPHHIVVNGVWELPFGKGKPISLQNPWIDGVVGGWSVQAIYQWQSGPPVGFGNIIFRGNLAEMVIPYADRTVERWFNIDAGFERNAARQLANNLRTFPLRLTGLRADGWNNWDLSLFKNFRIREGIRLQLRAEAQDALNHALLAAPNAAPVNTLFGTVNNTLWSEQRKITVAAKLIF